MFLLIIPIIILMISIFYDIIKNLLLELLPQNEHKKFETNYSEPIRIFSTNTAGSNNNKDEKSKFDFCFFINGFLGNSIVS